MSFILLFATLDSCFPSNIHSIKLSPRLSLQKTTTTQWWLTKSKFFQMFIVKIKLLISSVLLILMFSDIDLLSSFLLKIFSNILLNLLRWFCHQSLTKFRSSHPEMFFKKVLLEISRNSQENTWCRLQLY